MRIHWSPAAEADLLTIWIYLAREASEFRTDEQVLQIRQASERLSEWPKSGRTRDELVRGMRSIVAASYLIFYRLAADAVQIVRVLHGRRDVEAVFTEAP